MGDLFNITAFHSSLTAGLTMRPTIFQTSALQVMRLDDLWSLHEKLSSVLSSIIHRMLAAFPTPCRADYPDELRGSGFICSFHEVWELQYVRMVEAQAARAAKEDQT